MKKVSGHKKTVKRGRGRPATGKTPQRDIRIDDILWKRVQASAKAADMTVSAWVRKTLDTATK